MSIALIDGDHIPYTVCHNKKDEPIKSLDDCINLADNYIENLLITTKAKYYIIALTIGKGFRYDVWDGYKANRKKLEKPDWFYEVRQHLIDKWNAVWFEKLEADDICYIMSKDHSDRFIISPDKDLLNLEGKHYNPKKGEWVKTSEEEASRYFWKSMITGDQADGIKGIPKKGEAYFNNIISENLGIGLPFLILNAYIVNLGEYNGIKEYSKNYQLLKILDRYDGFVEPNPIRFKLNAEFTQEDN